MVRVAISVADADQRTNLHTFTVVFDETSHSEEHLARSVAERFGTTHHTLRVDPHALLTQWPAILGHMDQPTIDGVNSYFVSQAVAAHGVKAVISGIGGDEWSRVRGTYGDGVRRWLLSEYVGQPINVYGVGMIQ